MRSTQRLDRVLAGLGCGTRSEVKKLVKSGAVRVDGATARDAGMHIDPAASRIEVSGKALEYRKNFYLMLNKPAGVISATLDPRHRTVLDLLPDGLRRLGLFPAGRLDRDTEGLVLLTNDGELAHELLSPKKHVAKRYYALVEGRVTQREAELFKRGIELGDGVVTMPAELTVITLGETSEVELVIYEGKFHQVKRMFEAVGGKVRYLKRLSMGALELDRSLKPGEFRELSQREVEALKAGRAASVRDYEN